MTLRDRLEHPDRRTEAVQPIVERRGDTERRIPRWIERKNEQGLPVQDSTAHVLGRGAA